MSPAEIVVLSTPLKIIKSSAAPSELLSMKRYPKLLSYSKAYNSVAADVLLSVFNAEFAAERAAA